MVRVVLPILTLLTGCTIGRSLQPPPPSVVRTGLAAEVRRLAEKNLTGEGWLIELSETAAQGQSAVNDGEEWDESSFVLLFTARKSEGGQLILSPTDATPVLRGLRSDVRRLVTTAGGEVLETAETETYRERSAMIGYKLDKVTGWVKATIRPASDRPDETMNRLEVTVHEQPAK
jgi:hypothetical protein